MHKNEEEPGARTVRTLTTMLTGGVVGLLVCIGFCLLFSVAISAGMLYENIMYQLTVGSCLLGGLAGGSMTVRRIRSRTLIVGTATGVILFLLLLTVGIPLFGRENLSEGWIGLMCGSLCGGALAGLLGGRQKKRRK